RAAFIAHCAPLVRDVVLAGAERDEGTALIFSHVDARRGIAPDLANDTPVANLLRDPPVRGAVARQLGGFAAPPPRARGPAPAPRFATPNRGRSISAKCRTGAGSTSAPCCRIAPP